MMYHSQMHSLRISGKTPATMVFSCLLPGIRSLMLSYDRAIEHNKEIVYKKSFEENVNLFSSFIAWAEENKINVLMTVAPATQYYNLYIDNKFREGFYSILNELPQEIHVLDLSSSKEFTNDDFLDMDHLNEQGAIKYTSMIFDTIKKI